MRVDLDFKYKNLIAQLEKELDFTPDIAIVLGSGLGDFAKKIDIQTSVPTSSLPDYPKSTVEGHEGYIHKAELFGKKLLLFQGRIHFYEGYKLSECILPAYIASKFKAKYFFLTNAAGGVNPNFTPGNLMLITSHNSSNIWNELSSMLGVASIEQKNAMLNFPSKAFNKTILASALEDSIHLKEGVYWYNKGPAYETPAEIQMLTKLGNDAVGMSTVHEALYGAISGMQVSAISCITNMAAGITGEKLSHSEVMETAELVKEKFERLVKRIIKNI